IARAATIWLEGTLRVLLELFNTGARNPQIGHFAVAAETRDATAATAWELFLGPLQAPAGCSAAIWQPDDTILRALADDLMGLLFNKQLLWIRCCIDRDPDGEIRVDCRLNNTDWPEGRNQLCRAAKRWRWPRSRLVEQRRQFLLLKPTDQTLPVVAEKLQEHL